MHIAEFSHNKDGSVKEYTIEFGAGSGGTLRMRIDKETLEKWCNEMNAVVRRAKDYEPKE